MSEEKIGRIEWLKRWIKCLIGEHEWRELIVHRICVRCGRVKPITSSSYLKKEIKAWKEKHDEGGE